MTSEYFCFYLQNRLFQTSQTGGQWYSDTSPFSIPCTIFLETFDIYGILRLYMLGLCCSLFHNFSIDYCDKIILYYNNKISQCFAIVNDNFIQFSFNFVISWFRFCTIQKFSATFWTLLNFGNFRLGMQKQWQKTKKSPS